MKIQLKIRRKKKSIIRKIIVEGDTAMAKSTLDKAIQYDEAYNKEEDMESDRRLALLMEEQKARSVCNPTA